MASWQWFCQVLKWKSRAWCKTTVTTLFYIRRYNSFAPSPRNGATRKVSFNCLVIDKRFCFCFAVEKTRFTKLHSFLTRSPHTYCWFFAPMTFFYKTMFFCKNDIFYVLFFSRFVMSWIPRRYPMWHAGRVIGVSGGVWSPKQPDACTW